MAKKTLILLIAFFYIIFFLVQFMVMMSIEDALDGELNGGGFLFVFSNMFLISITLAIAVERK